MVDSTIRLKLTGMQPHLDAVETYCHGRRRYAFPIRLSRGDDVKVGPRSSDDEVCLSYIYSYD